MNSLQKPFGQWDTEKKKKRRNKKLMPDDYKLLQKNMTRS